MEYEALLAGMKVAKELDADLLLVMSDLQLVINQVSGQYQAKGENMVAYLEKVREAMARFKGVRMEPIPWDKNHQADVLAKINWRSSITKRGTTSTNSSIHRLPC